MEPGVITLAFDVRKDASQAVMSDPDWRKLASIAAGLDPEMPFEQKVAAVKLDPARDLRYGCWSGIDFRNATLCRCDFGGSDLSGANFEGARIPGAHFDRATLGRIIHKSENDLHAHPKMTPVANLRDAIDWHDFSDPIQWRLVRTRPTTPAYLSVLYFRMRHLRRKSTMVVRGGRFKWGCPPIHRKCTATEHHAKL